MIVLAADNPTTEAARLLFLTALVRQVEELETAVIPAPRPAALRLWDWCRPDLLLGLLLLDEGIQGASRYQDLSQGTGAESLQLLLIEVGGKGLLINKFQDCRYHDSVARNQSKGSRPAGP